MRPETHDMAEPRWGRNCMIRTVIDGGLRLRVALIMTPMAEPGDFLILRSEGGTTRYRVKTVEPCFNPSDMAFADLVFAPRQQEPTDAR